MSSTEAKPSPVVYKRATTIAIACIAGVCFLSGLVVLFTEMRLQHAQDAALGVLQDIATTNTETKLGRVTGLYIEGQRFNDSFCSQLREFPWMEALELRNTSITAGGLNVISKLPQLRTLWIDFPNVSDDEINCLSQMQSIQWLQFTTDGLSSHNSLRKLSALKNLQNLNLVGLPIDSNVLQYLQTTLPNCEISFEVAPNP
jgi:hypothetical protein